MVVNLGGRANHPAVVSSPHGLGQAAAETEARILVTWLEAGSGNGPTMSDGKTLFHADHGNKSGTGAVISDAALSAARLALRTHEDGRKLLRRGYGLRI